MNVIYLDKEYLTDEHYALALGFFDGLHQGHLALVDEVKKIADEKHLKSAIMTFDRHPLSLLKNEKCQSLISSNDRIELLADMGIDTLFVIRFTMDVAKLSPQAFIDQYLKHVDHLVVGFDFHFGHKNKGDVSSLSHQHFEVSVIAPIMYDKKRKVSSTLIKELLTSGNVEEANRLLTRPFSIRGEVVHGKKRGRTIGYPTANVDFDSYYVIRRGVYGVRVKLNDSVYYGMGNVGINPTFNELSNDLLEVHIFDLDEDLYGKTIKVEFIKFIRDEKTFSNIEELKLQLKKDEEQIKKTLTITKYSI
jgi:riboflavin kinase/FMN adenylyltransferase